MTTMNSEWFWAAAPAFACLALLFGAARRQTVPARDRFRGGKNR
jgi:hypothetical protein